MTIAIVLGAWCVLSFPAAVVIGCAIRAGALADARD
jgi:hypothetical protein